MVAKIALLYTYFTHTQVKAKDKRINQLEEAKKRDHRKLGAEMGLFAMDPEFVGPGLPLWLPKGTVLVEELEKLILEERASREAST